MEPTSEMTCWIDRYVRSQLALKRETTRATYALILRQFLDTIPKAV